jgi:hypothetical protein
MKQLLFCQNDFRKSPFAWKVSKGEVLDILYQSRGSYSDVLDKDVFRKQQQECHDLMCMQYEVSNYSTEVKFYLFRK